MLALAAALGACLFGAAPKTASRVHDQSPVSEQLRGRSPQWNVHASGPVCGVYAACTALGQVGIACSPGDYLTSRYVSAPQGSTPEDVAAIVTHAGGKATILSALSALDLRVLGKPVIANVRSTAAAKQYDHWAAVTCGHDEVTQHDGPGESVKLSLAEFLGLWSGLGIVVSNSDSWVVSTIWLGRVAVLQAVLLVLLLLRVVVPLAITRTSWTHAAATICLLTACATACGVAIFGDISHHFQGVQVAIAPYAPIAYRVGTLDDIATLVQRGNGVLVDARHESTFKNGSIPRAVNIPVDASLWQIRDFLQDVDRDEPIVVFCHSKSCNYNETVGRNLTVR